MVVVSCEAAPVSRGLCALPAGAKQRNAAANPAMRHGTPGKYLEFRRIDCPLGRFSGRAAIRRHARLRKSRIELACMDAADGGMDAFPIKGMVAAPTQEGFCPLESSVLIAPRNSSVGRPFRIQRST